MKETKVYVDELPESCEDCPCYDFDIGGCQCKDPHFTYQSINRFKGCPLIDIKTHDRELVKEVCEKIKNKLGSIEDMLINLGNGKEDAFNYFTYILDEVQKEYCNKKD